MAKASPKTRHSNPRKMLLFILGSSSKCRTTDEVLDFCLNSLGISESFCFEILYRLHGKGLIARHWTEKNGRRMKMYCVESSFEEIVKNI